MKQLFSLFLLIYFLFITACSEDVNSTKIISEVDIPNSSLEKKISKLFLEETKAPLETIHAKQKPEIKVIQHEQKQKEYTFLFKDLNQQSTTLTVKNDIYNFNNIQQPIVMINLFSTWCPPCRGELPHLNNLQQKFKDNLFILSALVHDKIKNEELSRFIVSEKLHLFVSIKQKEHLKFAELITPKLGLDEDFPLPLMIIFVNGKYFTHYEGIMPEEMIESDLKLLLKKIEKR